MSNHIWTVPARVVRVVDGDTLVLLLDLGWHITYESRCRLIGCNAPELGTDEGTAARDFVVNLLATAGPGAEVMFISHELDKYGRPLGQVLGSTPQGTSFDLTAELISSGHAVPM